MSKKNQKQINAKKAQTQYNQVESKPFDLKLLVAQVAAAQAAKKKVVSKKDKKKAAAAQVAQKVVVEETAQAKEEVAAAEVEEKTSKESLRKLKVQKRKDRKAIKDQVKNQVADSEAEYKAKEAVRLFGVVLRVVNTSRQVSQSGLSMVAQYQRRAQAALGVLRPGTELRIALFHQFMELSRQFKGLKVTEAPTEPVAPAEMAPEPGHEKDVRKKLLGDKKKDKQHPWKAMQKAIQLRGSQAVDKAKTGVAAVGNYGANMALVPYMVKSIAQVGPGLRSVGKAIEENGLDTMKWVGRQISNLNSRLQGMFRSAQGLLGADSPADWLALGALAMGVLPSLVEGLEESLKKRFGDNYIQGFISEQWTKTKEGVTMWLSDFIEKTINAITDLATKAKEKATEAAKAGAAWVKDKAATPFSKPADAPKPGTLTVKQGSAAHLAKATPREKLAYYQSQLARKDISPAERKEVELQLQQLVESTPSLYNNSQVIANLEAKGIKINASAKVTKAANTSVSTATTSNVSSGPVTGGSNTAVTVTPSASSTADNGPVTATKPPPAPPSASNESGSDAGSSGVASTGLSPSSIPNQAAGDTLAFFNMTGMGMA